MNATVYPINPFAPAYLQGLQTPPPEEAGYKDKYFDYVYEPKTGEIPASSRFTDVLPIDQDADFYVTGIVLSKLVSDSSPAELLIQMVDYSGFELTDGFISATTLSYASQNPTQQLPAFLLPAGSKLTLNFREVTGDPVSVQITFKGFKRFRREAA